MLRIKTNLHFHVFFIVWVLIVKGESGWAAVTHPPGAFVEVNGARLWYESEGNGPPLLLITGGPGLAHDVFHPYISSLARSHRVIYFDAFGRGKSDRAKDRSEYTFDRDVQDIEGLRKALHLEKIDVLGHSYGGMVAQAYALRFPGAVKPPDSRRHSVQWRDVAGE